MTKTHRILFAALGCLSLLATSLHAQVPNLLNYQGRVAVGTGASAVNFNGTGQFKFALVDSTGSTVYWVSSNDLSPADGVPDNAVSLAVTKGLYSVLLGQLPTKTIPASVWANADVWLRVWFNDGVNGFQLLAPDQRLAPTGYLSDGSVSSTAIATGAVTSAKIAAGAVTNTQLAAGAVQAANIAASSIATANLADGAVTAAKLDSANIGVWSVSGGSVFRNSGNVGIGASDNAALVVDGGAFARLGIVKKSGLNPVIAAAAGEEIIFAHSDQSNLFNNIGTSVLTERMRINGNGTVRFQLPASSTPIGAFNINVASFVTPANATNSYFLQVLDTGSGSTAFIVKGDGNVGIGTYSPAQRLHVQDSGAETGRIQVGGTGTTGASKIISFGDGDFVTIGENGLDDRLEIRAKIIAFTNATVGAGPPLEIYSGFLNGVADTNAVTLEMPGNKKLGIWDDLVVWGETTTTAVNITSDRNAKEQFKPVNAREVLAKVARLPITEWQYKARDESRPETARHIGPMAQDFRAAFALGHDEKHITSVDADGVALAAIQGLHEIVKEKDAELSRLQTENQSLAERLSAIERALGLRREAAPSER
jgi:hypothetical protein